MHSERQSHPNDELVFGLRKSMSHSIIQEGVLEGSYYLFTRIYLFICVNK